MKRFIFLSLIAFSIVNSIDSYNHSKEIFEKMIKGLEKHKMETKRKKILVYAYDHTNPEKYISCSNQNRDRVAEKQIANYFSSHGYKTVISDEFIKPEDATTDKCMHRVFGKVNIDIDTIIIFHNWYPGYGRAVVSIKEKPTQSLVAPVGKEDPSYFGELLMVDEKMRIKKEKFLKEIDGFSYRAKGIVEIRDAELLKKIKWLDLNGNYFISIPKFAPDNLERIFFGYNRFKFFPDLRLYKNLKIFEINNNQIEELNEGVLAENLEEIYLSQNYLRNLKGLEGLKKLKILSARQNKIEFVDNLKSIQSLEKVYLSVNQIRFINDEFNNLTNLKLLELDLNELIEISKLANPNLENLSIAGNRIDDLTGISRNKNLRVLDIRDNPVTDITELGKLGKLEKLFLDDKAILRSQILELQRVNSKLVVEFRRKGK